jgi:hypothetical protein
MVRCFLILQFMWEGFRCAQTLPYEISTMNIYP